MESGRRWGEITPHSVIRLTVGSRSLAKESLSHAVMTAARIPALMARNKQLFQGGIAFGRGCLILRPGMNKWLAWSGWRRQPDQPGTVRDGRLSMVCNVCGARSTCPLDELQREAPPCPGCGATVRQRAIIHLLSSHFFAASLALPDFPRRPDLRGAGMSDWEGFARPLARRLGYTHTYYHQAPADWLGTLDFLTRLRNGD